MGCAHVSGVARRPTDGDRLVNGDAGPSAARNTRLRRSRRGPAADVLEWAAMANGERVRILRVIARMNTGGPARQVAALARHLDGERFEHCLVVGAVGTDEADDLDLRAADVTYGRIRGLGRAPSALDDARALTSLVAEVRRFRPHIVHTHTAKAGVLGRMATLSAAPRPGPSRPALIHTFHGHLLHGYFSPPVTRALVGVERGLARVTNRLVAVGERVRDELLAARVGRPGQYVVVPPGIELGPLPDRAESRRRLGLPPDAPVVAYVARLTGVKRPDRFADAALRVAARIPTTQFVVAGGGELGADLRVRLAALGDRARLLGWWSDVEAVYAAADVVVLTSDNEGMPVSLIEAALAGLPAVATRVGSVAEVVVDGSTGLVVNREAAAVADGVQQLLGDPHLRATMGAAAARRASRLFSAQRLVADTEALYDAVLSDAPSLRHRRR